jgi:hypothetical protein
MSPLLALLLFGQQDVLLVEPRRSSPWTPPSGALHFTQRRVAGWRVSTWTHDIAGDRVVRLQRWQSGYTLIYQRWYLPGGASVQDRAEVVVGNCAHGDPLREDGGPEPRRRQVWAALTQNLVWCGVARDAAGRMLTGFDRAFAVVLARSRLAAADAATATTE